MPFPTPEQARVIEHRGRPLVVIAGPGTGKTSTLVARMIRLLEEDRSRHVSFITFTRTSRRDTQRRLEQAFGQQVLKAPDALFPRTMTLHTFAKSIVHRFAHVVRWHHSFSVLVDQRGEKTLVLDEVLDDLAIEGDPGEVSRALSSVRSLQGWPEEFLLAPAARTELLAYYEKLLALYRALDMEGVVTYASNILDRAGGELPLVFLQIDEYQDLNPSDQRLVSLAASQRESEVVVVGDDAQSIYGFRFANYQGLRTLWGSPHWDREPLLDSQRLPAHILNAALDLIADRGYLGAEVRRKPQDGRKILTLQCTTSDVQLPALAAEIRKALAAESGAHPLQLRDILILCPTAAFVDRIVNELSVTYGIPAHKPTAVPISDHVCRTILLLRILANRDPLALRQWLPLIGLTEDEIRQFRRAALNQAVPYSDYCFAQPDKRLTTFEHHLDVLTAAATQVSSFRHALAMFQGYLFQDPFFELIRHHLPDETAPLPPFERLMQLAYQELGVLDADATISDDNRVLVATLHSAKGLEAEYVLCPWMNARFMPMEGRDPEEQRRLLYVGMTRAKRGLILLFHEEFDQVHKRRVGSTALSPFLRGIASHLDVRRVRKQDVA